MRPRHFACVILLATCAATPAADRTGERTAAGMDAAVHATWTGLPLREWAARATTLAGRPVILDRRIDPDVPVAHTARGETLREVLAVVAASAGGVVEELARTVRIVPAAAAGRAIAADRDRVKGMAALPASLRTVIAVRRAWRWPAGATPRDLVEAAAADAGIVIQDVEAIPHDHFPAADLPPLPLGDRLDLVLAHFDRRVVWQPEPGGAAGRIAMIDVDPAPPAVGEGGDQPPRRKAPPRRTVTVRDEFTLRLEAPLDQALAAICGRLGLTLDLDAAGLADRGIAPGEIVRAEVERASRRELLDALLIPVGLAWKIEGDRLRVFPAASDPAP